MCVAVANKQLKFAVLVFQFTHGRHSGGNKMRTLLAWNKLPTKMLFCTAKYLHDQDILFQLGKSLAQRLLFKAPRTMHDTDIIVNEGWDNC